MDKIDVSSYKVDENLEKQINSLVENLRNDKEVYEIIQSWNVTRKLVRKNISKFADFQEDYNYCKNCPGLDKCKKNNPHLSLRLDIDGDLVTRNYSPCKKITEKIYRDSLYLYADFPEEWKEATYNSIDINTARARVINSFNKVINEGGSSWFYIYGPHKSGKSYFAATIMNEYVENKKEQAAYIDFIKRMKQLGDAYYSDKPTFEKMFENLSTVSLLIIDNFGSEYKSEFSRDSVLIPLLSARSNANLPTLFISTFSLDEIASLYSLKSKGGYIAARSLKELIESSTSSNTIFKLETIKGLYK